MPAYNFQSRFADAVQFGSKRQTIRALGKRRHATPGQPIQLYTGMMHKTCRKLITPDPVCTAVQRVRIEKFPAKSKHDRDFFQLYLDGEVMFKHEVREMAFQDGFDSPEDFFQFFDQTYFKKNDMPFEGVLIRW